MSEISITLVQRGRRTVTVDVDELLAAGRVRGLQLGGGQR